MRERVTLTRAREARLLVTFSFNISGRYTSMGS